jgi:hypothetical protein
MHAILETKRGELHDAQPIAQADLAMLAERARRRIVRWFKRRGFLDARAAANMLRWKNSGFFGGRFSSASRSSIATCLWNCD